ncbi:MAG: hypothetical protein JWP75_55 [Frondihabitans sp.]|nr:hypothetical protein [Frondihabitans sp.]
MSTQHDRRGRRKITHRIRVSTIIGAGLTALLLVLGAVTGGVIGVIVFAGTVAFLTALYTVLSGRKSWARLPSRKFAAIGLAVVLVGTIAGTAVASPAATQAAGTTPTARSVTPAAKDPAKKSTKTSAPTFSVDSPAAPATVTPADAGTTAVFESATTATDSPALTLLSTLPVKGKAAKSGYLRTADFGTAWLDVDHNGCDTRNDILARDLVGITKDGACTVTSGTLVSPYTAATISFVRGEKTSALVQIDHVVSLEDAWQTGAQQLSEAQRTVLANDPANLLAVDEHSNEQKGDGDAATWLPSNKAVRCTYVADQIAVKATYGLWVTQAEHDAMSRVLSSCPAQVAASSAKVVVKSTVPEFVGVSAATAQVTAAHAALKYVFVTKNGSHVRVPSHWRVTRQTPQADALSPVESVVTLHVVRESNKEIARHARAVHAAVAAHNAAVAHAAAVARTRAAQVAAHNKAVAHAAAVAAAAAAAQAEVQQQAAAAAAAQAAAQQAASPPAAPAQSQTAYITPGAYCAAADVGQVAQAANGRSYKCGGKGADANGDYHWNTM